MFKSHVVDKVYVFKSHVVYKVYVFKSHVVGKGGVQKSLICFLPSGECFQKSFTSHVSGLCVLEA